MSQTTITWGNDVQAQKKWSARLYAETLGKSYWEKFIGKGDDAVIQRKTELDADVGDRISFDLSVQLRGGPVSGDQRLEGNEEQLKFFSDEIIIDQLRKSVSCGGKMTRKRTAHDLRDVAKKRLSEWWGQYIDQMFFIYLSGARGMNENYESFPSDYAGHAGNPIRTPDGQHLLFGGSATSKATLTADDKMTRLLIEKASHKAAMMRALDPRSANLLPIPIGGSDHYVLVMNPTQAFDLRTEAGAGWLDIQKAAAAAEGKANVIFKGGLGMIDDIVLHKHRDVIRFSNYGAASNVKAARALFLGRQAGVVAYGTTKGLNFTWKEKLADYDNEPSVAAGTIIGISKTRFNKRDFGVVAIDTAAKDPNAA